MINFEIIYLYMYITNTLGIFGRLGNSYIPLYFNLLLMINTPLYYK